MLIGRYKCNRNNFINLKKKKNGQMDKHASLAIRCAQAVKGQQNLTV
jgi:hypothetical protein